MIILILQILALIFILIAAISISWLVFINYALNSKTLARRWQEKAVGRENVPSWGKVYESSTYKPIAGAVVKLYDAETREQLDFTTTNKEGQFGFVVPDGKFYLRVNSFYHSFPSNNLIKFHKPQLLRRRRFNTDYFGLFLPEIYDKSFENIYFGEVINNRSRAMQRIFSSKAELLEKIEAKTPILLNIPMDKEGVLTLDEITVESIKKRESAFEGVKITVLVLGIGLALATLILKPNLISLILLEAFFAFSLYSIFEGIRQKYHGSIFDKDNRPVQFALIRARGHRTKRIRATAISDSSGNFDIPLIPGFYTFEISRNNFEAEKRLIKLDGQETEKLNFKLKRDLP
ncbi:MAG: carboxypeptidase-like regulatory domain-containing protein [Candidatus Berkelbacteria bacterium]|nr:carboxypeptidase-like regulatory domain-containing protein [Candidatus Berkelbacteria bacterium]